MHSTLGHLVVYRAHSGTLFPVVLTTNPRRRQEESPILQAKTLSVRDLGNLAQVTWLSTGKTGTHSPGINLAL